MRCRLTESAQNSLTSRQVHSIRLNHERSWKKLQLGYSEGGAVQKRLPKESNAGKTYNRRTIFAGSVYPS